MQRQRPTLLKFMVRLEEGSSCCGQLAARVCPREGRPRSRETLFVKGKLIPEEKAPLLGGIRTGS